jgi:integral membrane protein
MLTHPVGRLRLIGMIEAVSFLLLLGAAMPLKYLAGRPEAVQVVGLAHGVLFLAFVAAPADAFFRGPLPFGWALIAFAAALLPAGPFVIDPRLRRFEESAPAFPVKGK